MTIKQDCQRLFKTDNLYKVLNVEKTENLTEGVVKKAYYKASLLYHPDKAPVEGDKSESTEKFQILSKVYTILVDKDKRDVYDDSGEVPNDLELESNFDWYFFWRNPSKFSHEDIKLFQENYKGSAEEKADLKRHYNDGDGQMDYIVANLLCATVGDEERLAKLLEEMIVAGELKKKEKAGGKGAVGPNLKVRVDPYAKFIGSYPKGVALILSNKDFPGETSLPTRVEAKKEVLAMVNLWAQMGFDVDLKRNLTADEMRQAMVDYKNDQRHAKCDSAVVVIMSHGLKAGVYGTDGQIVPLWDLVEQLSYLNCPSLLGKAKMIFVQANGGGDPRCLPDLLPPATELHLMVSRTPDNSDHLGSKGFIETLAKVFGEFYHEDRFIEMIQKMCYETKFTMFSCGGTTYFFPRPSE